MNQSLLTGLALARGLGPGDEGLREHPDWFEVARSRGAYIVDVAGADIDCVEPATGHHGDATRAPEAPPRQLRWRAAESTDAPRAMLLGVTDRPWLAALAPPENPANLRAVGSELDDLEAGLATTAVALAQWHNRSQRCPQCGGETEITNAGWARRCLSESLQIFPRTDPAVIVLVRDHDDRALLGRRAEWPKTLFSTFAGFVEAGESAEHTVLREIAEEAGVHVDRRRLHYRGSQPWPFPSSLMLGYHAQTVDRAPVSTPDGTEIVETRWFTREELLAAARSGQVHIPPPVSIARRLIEDWFGGPLPGQWPTSPPRGRQGAAASPDNVDPESSAGPENESAH